MKRLIITSLIILFLLPLSLTGKDKIILGCSPLGGNSILPESEYQISYMNPDGSVKWQKLNRMLQEIANTGANMWREFPPWKKYKGYFWWKNNLPDPGFPLYNVSRSRPPPPTGYVGLFEETTRSGLPNVEKSLTELLYHIE